MMNVRRNLNKSEFDFLDSLNSDEIVRLAHNLFCRMDAIGGNCYGIDRRTMQIVMPHTYAVYTELEFRMQEN